MKAGDKVLITGAADVSLNGKVGRLVNEEAEGVPGSRWAVQVGFTYYFLRPHAFKPVEMEKEKFVPLIVVEAALAALPLTLMATMQAIAAVRKAAVEFDVAVPVLPDVRVGDVWSTPAGLVHVVQADNLRHMTAPRAEVVFLQAGTEVDEKTGERGWVLRSAFDQGQLVSRLEAK